MLRGNLIVLRPFRLKWQMPDISLGLSPALTFMYEEASQILVTYQQNAISGNEIRNFISNMAFPIFIPGLQKRVVTGFSELQVLHTCVVACFSIAEEREYLLSPVGRCC